MDRQIGRLHESVRPHASHKLVLRDQVARPFQQSNEDLEGPTADTNRLVVLQKQAPHRPLDRTRQNISRLPPNFAWW